MHPLRVMTAGAADVSEQELKDFCRTQGLAGFKVPRVVRTQKGPLPMNSSGKVLKQDVGQQLRQLTPQRSRL